jgi:catechol 2,3-dioxygenase-like lactoylglutathione lyase family enzyme
MDTPALHHIALACRDLEATHKFYNGVLGLPLIHTEIQRYRGGWFKHVFYALGDGSSIAFFDLHGVGEPEGFDPAISTGLGLPVWVNHIALRAAAPPIAEIQRRLDTAGVQPSLEIDHGWCRSKYYTDPNGNLIELCADTPGFVPDETEALARLYQVPAASRG